MRELEVQMLNTTSTFPSDLGISTRIGLTRGVGRPMGAVMSFAEAETRYREERLIADARRRQARELRRAARRERPARTRILTGVTRWASWHSSDARRRSSAACTS